MLGEPPPVIKLGAVIYGRVSGYPWWPAVITECPSTHQWKKGGKYWVSFLNDTTGAWLKSTQIRPFDRYNHDLCHEHDSGVAKFRRYQDRINKAISIAETRLGHSSAPIRVKVLPPRRTPLPGDVSSAARAAGDHAPDNLHEKSTSLEPYPKRELPPALNADSDVPSMTHYNGAELVPRVDTDDLSVNAARPRRKRMRSIRYLEQDELRKISAAKKSNGQLVAKEEPCPRLLTHQTIVNGKTNEKQTYRFCAAADPSVQSPRRSRRLRSSTEVPDASRLAEKRSKRKRAESLSLDTNRGQLGGYSQKRSPESSALADFVSQQSGSENGRFASVAKRRARSNTAATKKNIGIAGHHGRLSKQMYVTELQKIAKQSNRKDLMTTNGRTVRGVRSLVGVRSNAEEEFDAIHDGTDSDERPEMERKCQVGSLETAAQDIVEYALNGYRSDSSELTGNVRDALALSNGDLLSSILNRLSMLEKDMSYVKKKAVSEEQGTLGEDATAAGVKSAVEALAAASAAFAKARGYNVEAIRRSVKVLWPNGQFPLAGADGDLLRTVAQSLILASCKRRQAELMNAEGKAQNEKMQKNEN